MLAAREAMTEPIIPQRNTAMNRMLKSIFKTSIRTILIKVASGFPPAIFIALYMDSRKENGRTSEFNARYTNTSWEMSAFTFHDTG